MYLLLNYFEKYIIKYLYIKFLPYLHYISDK